MFFIFSFFVSEIFKICCFYNGIFFFKIKIEGAPLEDGKGLSNWDVFSHIPGKWCLLI